MLAAMEAWSLNHYTTRKVPRLLILTSLSSSSVICLVPLYRIFSSVSSSCLILCVYFYVLGILVISLILENGLM